MLAGLQLKNSFFAEIFGFSFVVSRIRSLGCLRNEYIMSNTHGWSCKNEKQNVLSFVAKSQRYSLETFCTNAR